MVSNILGKSRIFLSHLS